MTRPITIQVATDTSKVAQGFAPLETALKEIVTDAEQVEESLEDISDVTVDIDIRQQAIDQAKRDIERLKDEIAENVVMGIDTKAAERRVASLMSSVRKLDDQRIVVDVDVDTTGVDKGLRGMEALRSGTAETATSLGSLNTGLQGVSGFALSAQFALADLSETLADVAEANRQAGRETGRFTRGLGAVAGFAAGPWGIALTAGIALLGTFGASMFEAGEATKALEEGIDRMAGALDQHNRELVANKLEEEGALELFERWGISTDEVVTALLNGRDAHELYNDALRRGFELDKIRGRTTGETLQDYESLKTAYEDTAESLGLGADKHGRLNRAIGETAEAVENSATKVEEANDLWKDYRDTIDDARSKLDGLIDGLDIFNGRIGDSKQASADYAEQQRDLNEALEAGTVGMKVSTEVGAKNDKMIRDQAENIAQLAEARLKDAGSSGESSDQILSDYAKQREALIVMADKLGLSGAEAKKYVDHLLRTPEDVKSDVKLIGADEAIDTMEEVSKTRYADVIAQVRLDEQQLNQAIGRMHDAMSNVGFNIGSNFGGPAPRSVAPAPPMPTPYTLMQPRIYLDSQPITYAMRPAVRGMVRSSVNAVSQHGRL